MNADVNATEIITVLLLELLFGIGYDALVAWTHKNKLVHVSTSVVVGVAVTLLIPAAAWFDHEMAFWEAGILLALCFAASGTPMIVGSLKRTAKESADLKDQKKRRPWPNEARRARDDVVMELSAMAHEIAGKTKERKLELSDLPDYVNRMHRLIGILKGV